MRIVLFEPEIPPNTGNVARLCAATGTELHLIEPLGFKLENRYLKRRHGSAPVQHFAFQPEDSLIFGPETRGLPPEMLDASPHHVRIPMREGGVRSLNLSTSAGIVLYMALAASGLLEQWT